MKSLFSKSVCIIIPGFITIMLMACSLLGDIQVSNQATQTTENQHTQSGRDLPQVITDTQGVRMSLIPGGDFKMGRRGLSFEGKPVHTVYLDPFHMDIYEVTNDLYKKCEQAGVCGAPINDTQSMTKSNYDDPNFADYPVVYVNWQQASDYCKWRGARLPTEAEWEKAARGGLDGKLYPWGDEPPVCAAGAENGAQMGICPPGGPMRVGTFAPNGYGLYDMGGNAWEWLADWFDPEYYSHSPVNNPAGPDSGTEKAIRIGVWYFGELIMSMGSRAGEAPGNKGPDLGFRCAASPP